MYGCYGFLYIVWCFCSCCLCIFVVVTVCWHFYFGFFRGVVSPFLLTLALPCCYLCLCCSFYELISGCSAFFYVLFLFYLGVVFASFKFVDILCNLLFSPAVLFLPFFGPCCFTLYCCMTDVWVLRFFCVLIYFLF